MSKYEFRGTPGPWGTDCQEHDHPYQSIKVKASKFRTVCTVEIDDAPVDDFNMEQRANAQAIAEVPELISEGANLVAVLEGEGGTKPDALCRFKAALAKATVERTGGGEDE